MSSKPSTPVKVPSSAASYTPATLDPDLRSQINTVLLRDGHITRIQDSLLHALNSNNHNWPAAIQSHALTLLRSGEITTFPALLRRVLDDIRADSLQRPQSANGKTANGTSTSSAAADAAAGSGGNKVNGLDTSAAPGSAGKASLAVPEAVIEEALRVARESLETVCELEEPGPG